MLLHGGTTAGASRIVFNNTYYSSADQRVYTFANCAIGDPEPSRLVIVPVYATKTDMWLMYVDNVSIGGIAADYYLFHGYTSYALEVWAAVVPEGTTADIVVELNTDVLACEIATLSAYNQSPDSYAYPSLVSTNNYSMPMFEGGVAVVAVPNVTTITGLDAYHSGTTFTVGRKLASGAGSVAYSHSDATITEAPYGGVSFGP